MNATELALKLIQSYKEEYNRERRAANAQRRAYVDPVWVEGARARGLRGNVYDGNYSRKLLLKSFLSETTGYPTQTHFVSSAAKNGAIRRQRSEIKRRKARNFCEGDVIITSLERHLCALENAPVEAELGKLWQKQVKAYFEEKAANKARWEVRCAINVFNRMNLGIKIKFGNCRPGGGSMSYISHVEVDGCKIKLAKFLDNAVFESAILSS